MSRFLRTWPAALLTLAILVSGSFGPAAPSVSAEPGCIRIWHEKRVKKVVRKDGKRVVTYRIKRWWTCDPYEAPGPPRLGVSATEFKFTLSRPYVKSGNLVLEFSNRGEDEHNLRIATKKGKRILGAVPDTRPRVIVTDRFELKPGRYRMWCALPGHAKLGMKSSLKVVR